MFFLIKAKHQKLCRAGASQETKVKVFFCAFLHIYKYANRDRKANIEQPAAFWTDF